MVAGVRDELVQYYRSNRIYPFDFDCPHQDYCREFAYQDSMIGPKMSLVGSRYGTEYPRVVVVSLDPPDQGDKFLAPEHRTTEYISATTEAEDYTVDRPNTHWAMTQIIVKDILQAFGYPSIPGAALVEESYAGRPIDNITPYFAHVNVAKCCMRDPNKRQGARKVHEKCAQAFLEDELTILQPDILITQGKSTNEIMGGMLMGTAISEKSLPMAFVSYLFGKNVLWMPMRHPTQQLHKIRRDWPTYEAVIRDIAI